jgi:two-component system cell cycle response regulator
VGYAVVTAAGVAQALAYLEREVPDLIVSDVHLHEKSGFDLLEAVKAAPGTREVPFVFLSSTSRGSKDRTRGIAMGARKFILRPLEVAALLRELEDCLPNG